MYRRWGRDGKGTGMLGDKSVPAGAGWLLGWMVDRMGNCCDVGEGGEDGEGDDCW